MNERGESGSCGSCPNSCDISGLCGKLTKKDMIPFFQGFFFKFSWLSCLLVSERKISTAMSYNGVGVHKLEAAPFVLYIYMINDMIGLF